MSGKRVKMTEEKAKEILDNIIQQIFGYMNPLSLEQFKTKYAFDLRLPTQVNDSLTGEPTWAQSTNPLKYITMANSWKRGELIKSDSFINDQDWMLKKRPLNNIEDVLRAWEEVNYTTSDREMDSMNIAKSDNVVESENVFHSMDIIKSKNVIFSDGAIGCENVAAVQRSNTLNYCARVEDSTVCSNSFSVSWSGNIDKSMFIHDGFDLYECLFCSHIKSKKFCIANIQLEEDEYYKLKKEIIEWILIGE